LWKANLWGAILTEAALQEATLVRTAIVRTMITGVTLYGTAIEDIYVPLRAMIDDRLTGTSCFADAEDAEKVVQEGPRRIGNFHPGRA